MISFEQARQIVAEKRGPRYSPDDFSVNDWGWETPERWIVTYESEAIDSRPVLSVDKQTGEYFEDPGPAVGENPFPDKTPVGPNPRPSSI